MKKANFKCPCGSGKDYPSCCGIYLETNEKAQTAEQLMRSRYTAYVKQNSDYLLNTWHISTRPKNFNPNIGITWLNLQVIDITDGLQDDSAGTVYFEVTYAHENKNYMIRELARFVKEKENWFYLQGDQSKLTILN